MKVKNISLVRIFTSIGVTGVTTIFMILCRYTNLLSYFNATKRGYIITFILFGIFLLITGIYFSFRTAQQHMKNIEVVQTSHSARGIYSSVRHPIYSSILLITSGLLFITYNFLGIALIGINWFIFTLVIIFLEEPRLLDKLDTDYLEYTIETNRLIPWFSQYFKPRNFNKRDQIYIQNAERFLEMEIEAPIMGTYFQTMLKIFWFRRGICFITDKEIGFYSYDVFRGHHAQLVRFERISSFTYGRSNFGHSLKIQASNTSINLYFINKGEFKRFVRLTKKKLDL